MWVKKERMSGLSGHSFPFIQQPDNSDISRFLLLTETPKIRRKHDFPAIFRFRGSQCRGNTKPYSMIMAVNSASETTCPSTLLSPLKT